MQATIQRHIRAQRQVAVNKDSKFCKCGLWLGTHGHSKSYREYMPLERKAYVEIVGDRS